MEQEIKKCGNCKYFIKYYYKSNNKVWSVEKSGKCKNRGTKNKKHCYPVKSACEKWELCDEEAVMLARKDTVITYIKRMKKKLDELVLLLKEEENP